MTLSGARVLLFSTALGLAGCAVLHHVQVGDIDNTGHRGRKVDVKVSETGVNLQEAADIAKSLTRSKQAQKDIGQAQTMISMFQMGPHTGNGVFDETYAEGVIDQLLSQCPSGRLTGLMSVRETRKYPVISGEIVKVTGTCLN
jgi:hypothetical protein